MIQRLLFLSIVLVGLNSCGDDNDIPQCIDDILTDYKAVACTGDDLSTWDFNGDEVYCFAYQNCSTDDDTADIYDENCVLLCTLGGSAGVSTCLGFDWGTNATRTGTIWVKD